MYVIFSVSCSKLCVSFRKIQIYATVYKPPSEILCVIFYPGIQIFVLLTLSSVHQWCHFLNVLFEATKVSKYVDACRSETFQGLMPLIMSVQVETDHCKVAKCFFSLHSYYYWLINSLVTGEFTCTHTLWCNKLSFSNIFTVFVTCFLTDLYFDLWPPLRSLCFWLPVNGTSALSQLQGRYCVTCEYFRLCKADKWTSDAPPTCLDQLKSVSHLSRAVLVYRVSVNTFLHVVLKEGWIRAAPYICFCLRVSLPALHLFSNFPPGGEHSDYRCVLLRLLFLPFPFRLLAASPLLLQRWAPPLLVPLPATVGHHTHINDHKLARLLINSLTPTCCCFISSPGVTPPRTDEESLGHKARKSRLTESKKKKKKSLNNQHPEALFETQCSAIEVWK